MIVGQLIFKTAETQAWQGLTELRVPCPPPKFQGLQQNAAGLAITGKEPFIKVFRRFGQTYTDLYRLCTDLRFVGFFVGWWDFWWDVPCIEKGHVPTWVRVLYQSRDSNPRGRN